MEENCSGKLEPSLEAGWKKEELMLRPELKLELIKPSYFWHGFLPLKTVYPPVLLKHSPSHEEQIHFRTERSYLLLSVSPINYSVRHCILSFDDHC